MSYVATNAGEDLVCGQVHGQPGDLRRRAMNDTEGDNNADTVHRTITPPGGTPTPDEQHARPTPTAPPDPTATPTPTDPDRDAEPRPDADATAPPCDADA